MKHIYSIVLLISLLLTGASCEDDYRDMMLFTGEEPIYQVGTCANSINTLGFYLTKPEGVVVGVDGGSGGYVIVNGDETIATADFTTAQNGYDRILITPKGEGETSITVRDSDGKQAVLRVWVAECVKYVLTNAAEAMMIKGDFTAEQETQVAAAFVDKFTVKVNGRYELIPDDVSDAWEQGTLRVYPENNSATPILGRYDSVPITVGERQLRALRLTFNDEEHIYSFSSIPEPTRTSYIQTMFDCWEEVTDICPIELPEGCKVYHVQRLKWENYDRY